MISAAWALAGSRRGRRGGDDPDPGNGREPLGQLVAVEPGFHIHLERGNPDLQRADLLRQGDDDFARQRGNVRRCTLDKPVDQLEGVLNALCQHDAELGQLGADHVDQLGPLANQKIPRPMQRQHRLLFGRLDRHEPHRRPAHGFGDRLRITRVRLAALDIGLDVARRHQPHLVPQSLELARPEVARAAGLHADQAGLEPAEERHHLTTAQRPADNHCAGAVDAVDLKNVLGQIEADGANLHGGWLLLLVVLDGNHTFGT